MKNIYLSNNVQCMDTCEGLYSSPDRATPDELIDGLSKYTLSPTIKRFADEKPKESGRYWIKYNDDAHWYTANYFGELWFDEDSDQLSQPDLWCEIILPEDK